MDDLISRQTAIDALDEQIALCDKALKSFGISMKDEYAVKVERASLVAFREILEYLPPAPLGTNLAEVGTDTISRKQAIDALDCINGVEEVLRSLPPAQPHTYRGVPLNDVMMYFDSLEGNEDAWTEFCSCLECRGWGLYHMQSATDKNVGTTISRQQAIDAVTDELDMIDHVPKWVFDRLEKRLKQLPPAQPEQRTGKWIRNGWAITCSECGYDMPYTVRNFCPNCGAKMGGDAE